MQRKYRDFTIAPIEISIVIKFETITVFTFYNKTLQRNNQKRNFKSAFTIYVSKQSGL